MQKCSSTGHRNSSSKEHVGHAGNGQVPGAEPETEASAPTPRAHRSWPGRQGRADVGTSLEGTCEPGLSKGGSVCSSQYRGFSLSHSSLDLYNECDYGEYI